MSVLRSSSGFTLIELLIVTSLTIVLLLGASALFMTFLVTNSKGNVLKQVNQEGQYALSQMSFIIRNAIEVLPNGDNVTCAADMDEFVVRSIDEGTTSFLAESDNGVTKIASNSGVYLTSNYAQLTSGPTFDCTQTGGTKYVTIQFTLRKGTPGLDQAKEIVEQSFSSSVSIRSY